MALSESLLSVFVSMFRHILRRGDAPRALERSGGLPPHGNPRETEIRQPRASKT